MKSALKYIGLLLLGISKIALCAVATTTFTVTAQINATCNVVTATNLAFGTYNPFLGTPNDQSNVVSPTCTNGTPYTIALNAGSTTGATIANRLMAQGSSTLAYNIYTAADRATVWGDGTGGSSTVTGTGTGASQNYTAYGRIAAGQTGKPIGSYNDTVTVTVTY